MAFYTKAQARNAAQRTTTRQYSTEARTGIEQYSDWQRFDIFLSHSLNDVMLVIGVKQLLEDQGYSVYVDWIVDNELDRSMVNPKTAALLRKRMRQSSSLVYIATESASSSKWMPWELGYFDGFKPDGVAILPLLDSESASFEGQEYLGLYPVVQHGNIQGRNQPYVDDKRTHWSFFKGFVQGQPSWRRY